MFKIGDKIKLKENCSGFNKEEICTLYKHFKGGFLEKQGAAVGNINEYGLAAWNETSVNQASELINAGCACPEHWELV